MGIESDVAPALVASVHNTSAQLRELIEEYEADHDRLAARTDADAVTEQLEKIARIRRIYGRNPAFGK